MHVAISILPLHPERGVGWKLDEALCKSEETGESFVNCINEKAYSTADIFTSTSEKDVFTSTLNHAFKASYSYTDETTGPYQVLNISAGSISNKAYRLDSLQIRLNPNISYYVVFTDPKLNFLVSSPDTIPRTLISLKQHAGELWPHLKVLSYTS